MKKISQIFISIALLTLLGGCEFISNTYEYRNTTVEFTEALINEDYDNCMQLFALEHESAQNVNRDTMRASLPEFRNVIIGNFGEKLDYSLMGSEKTFSTNAEMNTPPNTTLVHIQVENETEFGVLKVLFDDESKKILNLIPLNIKEEIPNLIPFWLFGLLAICIPAFNIYVINLVRNSDLKRKWLKYLGILFFNVPAITYSAVKGLSIKLLNFQILFGISFSYMGYINSVFTFGIPLGGLYWLWRSKTNHKKIQPTETDIADEDILDKFEEAIED